MQPLGLDHSVEHMVELARINGGGVINIHDMAGATDLW